MNPIFSKCASTFYWFTANQTVWNGASLRRLEPAFWVVKQTRNEWYFDATAEIVIKAYRMSNGQFALVHWIKMWTLWMKIAKRSVYARGSIIISEGWFLLAANSERSGERKKIWFLWSNNISRRTWLAYVGLFNEQWAQLFIWWLLFMHTHIAVFIGSILGSFITFNYIVIQAFRNDGSKRTNRINTVCKNSIHFPSVFCVTDWVCECECAGVYCRRYVIIC